MWICQHERCMVLSHLLSYSGSGWITGIGMTWKTAQWLNLSIFSLYVQWDHQVRDGYDALFGYGYDGMGMMSFFFGFQMLNAFSCIVLQCGSLWWQIGCEEPLPCRSMKSTLLVRVVEEQQRDYMSLSGKRVLFRKTECIYKVLMKSLWIYETFHWPSANFILLQNLAE